MAKMRLLGLAAGVLACGVLAVAPAYARATSTRSLLELRLEGKQLTAGTEVVLVAGYSLGSCYWEEQEFKVTVNRSKSDKLIRSGQPGQFEGCDGGARSIEITSANKMLVRLAPMRQIIGPSTKAEPTERSISNCPTP